MTTTDSVDATSLSDETPEFYGFVIGRSRHAAKRRLGFMPPPGGFLGTERYLGKSTNRRKMKIDKSPPTGRQLNRPATAARRRSGR